MMINQSEENDTIPLDKLRSPEASLLYSLADSREKIEKELFQAMDFRKKELERLMRICKENGESATYYESQINKIERERIKVKNSPLTLQEHIQEIREQKQRDKEVIIDNKEVEEHTIEAEPQELQNEEVSIKKTSIKELLLEWWRKLINKLNFFKR